MVNKFFFLHGEVAYKLTSWKEKQLTICFALLFCPTKWASWELYNRYISHFCVEKYISSVVFIKFSINLNDKSSMKELALVSNVNSFKCTLWEEYWDMPSAQFQLKIGSLPVKVA